MATTGLYSQHLNNKKVLYFRNTVITIVLVLLAVATLFPIVYMIMSSFGPNVATAGICALFFPAGGRWSPIRRSSIFNEYSVKWIWNSVVVALFTVLGNVVFASMAGYAFAKIRFKGSNFLFATILVAMMIPYQVTQVPLYILIVKEFKMTNTYAAMILPSICTAYNIFPVQAVLHRSAHSSD